MDTAFSMPYMETEMFLKIWEKHDKDKILFASDSPWGKVKEDIEAIQALPIAETEKQKIFSENAKKLMS